MLIYKYDPITNEYVESLEAFKDKVASRKAKKDVYFMPAYTTELKPPKYKEGEVAIFKNGKWEIVEDHRGQVIYEIATRKGQICDTVGKLPKGFCTKLPERIEDLRALYLQTMKANFDICMRNTKLLIPSTNLYFSYDSVERLKNEQTLGITMSRDDNNKIYSLSREEYSVVLNYLVIYGQYMYLQKWNIESIIKNCKDVDLLRTHQKEIEFKVNPKLINNIVKMTPEKRREYFTRMLDNIK